MTIGLLNWYSSQHLYPNSDSEPNTKTKTLIPLAQPNWKYARIYDGFHISAIDVVNYVCLNIPSPQTLIFCHLLFIPKGSKTSTTRMRVGSERKNNIRI
jgi:hypothetical protein